MAKIWSPIQFCSSHSQEITQEEIQLANLNFMQVMIGRVSFESCRCPLSIVLSIPKFDTPLHSLEIHNPRNGHPHWHSSSLPGSKMSEVNIIVSPQLDGFSSYRILIEVSSLASPDALEFVTFLIWNPWSPSSNRPVKAVWLQSIPQNVGNVKREVSTEFRLIRGFAIICGTW